MVCVHWKLCIDGLSISWQCFPLNAISLLREVSAWPLSPSMKSLLSQQNQQVSSTSSAYRPKQWWPVCNFPMQGSLRCALLFRIIWVPLCLISSSAHYSSILHVLETNGCSRSPVKSLRCMAVLWVVDEESWDTLNRLKANTDFRLLATLNFQVSV